MNNCKIRTCSQLKPCPFCGGEAFLIESECRETTFAIMCDDCEILIASANNGTVDFFKTAEEAAEAWTRRP